MTIERISSSSTVNDMESSTFSLNRSTSYKTDMTGSVGSLENSQSLEASTGGLLAGLNSPRKQKAYLVRHGQTLDNVDEGQPIRHSDGRITPSPGKKYSGKNDVELSGLGEEQAVEGGQTLRHRRSWAQIRDGKWIKSGLRRTDQTADGVLLGFGDENHAIRDKMITDVRFQERDPGDALRGKTWKEGAKIWPELAKGRDAVIFKKADAAFPGGQSLEMVTDEAYPAFEEQTKDSEYTTIVGHELMFKGLIEKATTGKLTDNAFKIQVKNGEPIVLEREIGDELWHLESQPQVSKTDR